MKMQTKEFCYMSNMSIFSFSTEIKRGNLQGVYQVCK